MNRRRIARLFDRFSAELGAQLDDWSGGDPDLAHRIAVRTVELLGIEYAAGVTICPTVDDLVRLLDVAATFELDFDYDDDGDDEG